MTTDFDYSVFDRQLQNLLSMSLVLVEGWDDYITTEQNCDLMSLRTKAVRVCNQVDIDMARQQEDITQGRMPQNQHYKKQLQHFVYEQLLPFVKRLVDQIKAGELRVRIKPPVFPTELDAMMERIIPLLSPNEQQQNGWEELQGEVKSLEKLYHKKVKPSTMPGMQLVERMRYLLQYTMLMCYLLFHFERLTARNEVEMDEKEAGYILLSSVQNYTISTDGQRDLERYRMGLLFDNDNQPLSLEELREARKELRKEVPDSLQLPFMQHACDLTAMAGSILETDTTPEEVRQLISVLAKWQMLTADMEAIEHPETTESALPNEIFHRTVHGRPVDMLKLRTQLLQVLPLITRKNHWFCLWCVLRHRGLLKNENAEAFARQMQQPEWLGQHIREELAFTGDTLRQYNGYLSVTSYTHWDFNDFCIYRTKQNKDKKWSDALFKTFSHLCYDMDEKMG